MPKPHSVTPDRAEAHEGLYLRLAKLLKQTETIASRKPDAEIPAETRALASDLLFEVRPFLARSLARKLPLDAAPGFAGLAAQLGQALAGLDAFEARHSAWNPELGCFVWLIGRDATLPVARLRPETSAIITSLADKRHGEEMRNKLLRLIEAKAETAYEDGYADATAGRPSSPPPSRLDRL